MACGLKAEARLRIRSSLFRVRTVIGHTMSTLIQRITSALGRLRRLRRTISLPDIPRVVYAAKTKRTVGVLLKGMEKRILIRGGTTDIRCLEKVFLEGEYGLPFDLNPKLIVDAGANIGMATLHFARQYPQARVVAIEPEDSNFAILQRNCGWLPNAVLIQGALWPVKRALQIQDHAVDSWSFRVGEQSSAKNGASISAVTIPEILDRMGAEQIDLLKIDIEGAELELFSIRAEEWIDRVNMIAIELHDRFRPGCGQAFYSVIAKQKFIQEVKGENIFVKMLDRPTTEVRGP
jgi:FkbM family methyltransferase